MSKVINENTRAFFEIIRAGLWEKKGQLAHFKSIDFREVYRLAEEQSVIGLAAAGLEHIVDVKAPKEVSLRFVGHALQLEQRNSAMNQFIEQIVDKMRREDIYALLVKGQGIAQCYERPLWRTPGDVDFYLSGINYMKAKNFLTPLAQKIEPEDKKRLHLGMMINSWIVELHGTLHTGISKRINNISDEVHYDIFYRGNVRSWSNNGVTVFLPSPNNDVIVVFNHFITHFYGEGVGLRQICDWCRLLWKFNGQIDYALLEKRLKRMRLMDEWNVFGSFAVNYLGMPAEIMPFYENNSKNKRKAQLLAGLIIESGNFGSNKDNSYRGNVPKLRELSITLIRRMGEFGRISFIFPVNSLRFFLSYLFYRVKAVAL
ncbi:MAG: nucleotidyltransferase family protein [Bacteroidota bacterium]|nr:nucleotidyltransferase family protein [Bacteroidota bacterium]